MTGISQGLSLLYLTNYLLLSSSVNVVFALALPFSLLGIPMWAVLITKFDRKRMWAVGMGMSGIRSEEHTSELQSLMRISYAVFCLKKKNTKTDIDNLTK